MNRRLLITGALALAASLSVSAQGLRGGGRGQAPRQRQAALDMSRQFTIEGPVTAVNIAYGAQYPSIEIDKTLIKVGPAWWMLESDFEIKAGDRLRVTAAPAVAPGDSYAHAIEITNVATNQKLMLRDALGMPEWSGGRAGGDPRRAAQGSGCIDASTISTIAGTVDKVSIAAGIQQPTLVIKTADGKLVSVKMGPERILLENDFELNVGESVAVKAAFSPCCDGWIALAITNAAGVTVVLREDDGTPAW